MKSLHFVLGLCRLCSHHPLVPQLMKAGWGGVGGGVIWATPWGVRGAALFLLTVIHYLWPPWVSLGGVQWQLRGGCFVPCLRQVQQRAMQGGPSAQSQGVCGGVAPQIQGWFHLELSPALWCGRAVGRAV